MRGKRGMPLLCLLLAVLFFSCFVPPAYGGAIPPRYTRQQEALSVSQPEMEPAVDPDAITEAETAVPEGGENQESSSSTASQQPFSQISQKLCMQPRKGCPMWHG